jgi:hypothetical protein
MQNVANGELPPIRLVTRLLAAMQTGIVSAGVRALDGDLDRFVIFTLISRQSMGEGGEAVAGSPISVHALAASLSRPYETVRRHVGALVDLGMCVRSAAGVEMAPAGLGDPRIVDVMTTAHDCFVQFVEDLHTLGVPLPQTRPGLAYRSTTGVQAAADLMLAVSDTNRGVHRDWGDLVIFSTILWANVRGYARDRELAPRYRDQRLPAPDVLRQPVRPSAVARVIGIPASTVRRRLQPMIEDGRLTRHRRGLIVSEDWLNRETSVATSTATYHNTRRILERSAAAGFPFSAPGNAYLSGPPAESVFG